MKLLHIADLHIGKRVHGLPMISEQLHLIDQLRDIAVEEQVSGVLIAGDVFDRPVPSREALEVCERLFSAFCEKGVPVFAIPGNHDSPQQLAFCSALLARSGLHVAKAFDGSIDSFDLSDGRECVHVHLLPFVRPTDVRMAMPERAEEVVLHEDAVRIALSTCKPVTGAVNILVAHQFVTSGDNRPLTCDSEFVSVGGADNVDASVFDAFDYVALGHLHGPQRMGRETIRYAGSPLKYSFSEVSHEKSVTIVKVENGEVSVSTRKLSPLHDMREVTASYEQLAEGFDDGDHQDYMRITLTDKTLPEAMAKLRILYPYILRLDWQHFESPGSGNDRKIEEVRSTSPLELFESFYRDQTGLELSEEEREVVVSCFEKDVQ